MTPVKLFMAVFALPSFDSNRIWRAKLRIRRRLILSSGNLDSDIWSLSMPHRLACVTW